MSAADQILPQQREPAALVPPVRHDALQRARLAALRRAAQRSRVVLISAPAGYGKSTLAAQWSDADSRPGGWVQLGHGDNDPVVLLARVAAALERIGTMRHKLLEELSRRSPRIDEIVLPLLAADLAERDPFVLVLDDVDLITGQKSRAILSFLTDQVGSGSQLVLVSRGNPGVPLARLRAGGDVFEIGATTLALDANETRQIAASGGLELSDVAAEALRERTEGWAAGVALATLSLRGRDDAATRAARLTGDQPQIADYLIEEVLERQSDELRRFLLATSILDRMNAPLCDAVLGTSDAADSLDALARSNAFVVPLDDRREWYRYHRLFGDLLRRELERHHPDLLSTYLSRAALWCERHGRPDEAFAYAHASGDLAHAGRIALRHWDELAGRGQIETLRLWLDRCTDEEIESDAQLAISAAWVAVLLGQAVRGRRFVAAAERSPLDVASADGSTSLRSALANVRSAVAPDGIHGMLRDAEFVYAAEKQAGTRWVLSACRALGVANVLLGRRHEAIAAFSEALALTSDRPELAHVRVFCLGYLAFAATETGDRRSAERWVAEAMALVEGAHLEAIAQSTVGYAAAALVRQQRGDHLAAARHLERVRRLGPLLHGVPWLSADVALRCADISLDAGDLAGALDFAEVADDALRGYPDAGVLPARRQHLAGRISSGEAFGLTPAELRLVGFLATHQSLQEIADRVYLSRATVKTHVASIYHKLGVPGRSEAVEIIERAGLGPPPSRPAPAPQSD